MPNAGRFSREDRDLFAVESHRRAIAANEAGYFNDEILDYEVNLSFQTAGKSETSQQSYVVSHDEDSRPDSTLEALARLRTVFKADGSVTAASSSQMSDGAAAVLLVSEKILKQYDLEPPGRFISSAVVGVAPEVMGIGPKEAPLMFKTRRIKTRATGLDRIKRSFCRTSPGRL